MDAKDYRIGVLESEIRRYKNSLIMLIHQIIQNKYPGVFNPNKTLPAIRNLLEADISCYQIQCFFDEAMGNKCPEFVIKDMMRKFPKVSWTIDDLKDKKD